MGDSSSARKLVGYAIHATDGSIGKILEFCFDDSTWGIRYVVVDVGNWLLHKGVLVSPKVLGLPDVKSQCVPASISLEQVRHSPKIETDMPIALQSQAYSYSGWDVYWGSETQSQGVDSDALLPQTPNNLEGKPFDPHLRTTRAVTGHWVIGRNGPMGRVEDFDIDCATWTIRNLVVRAEAGGLVNLPTSEITRINFKAAAVFADLSAGEEQIMQRWTGKAKTT